MNDTDNLIKNLKKDFFALRNGIVADSLKQLYSKDKIIYGLTVPQFNELAKKYPHDIELGLHLWNDNKCRENRLFALFILPPAKISKDMAKTLIRDVESIEEADLLSFKVLRNLPFAKELYQEMLSEVFTDKLQSYCMGMFKKNIDQI